MTDDPFPPSTEYEDFITWLQHVENELADDDCDDDDGNAPLEYA